MMTGYRNLTRICLVAVLAFGLAACGGSSTTTEPPPPPPDPIEVERKAISDALAAAQAAAAMVTDTATDEQVAAADMAVAAAMKAIDDATHISAGEAATNRTSLAAIQSGLTAAKSSRTMTMTIASERMAISGALAAATAAVGAVMDDSDDDTVTAAEDAIAAATAAIDAAGHILASESAAERAKVAGLQTMLDVAKSSRQMAMDAAAEEERKRMAMEARRTEQLNAIMMAIAAARTAVAAVNDMSDQDTVDAANAAVASAKMKIDDAADVADDVKATHTASVTAIEGTLTTALASRTTAMAASQELANQRKTISDAIAAAKAAVAAVMDDSDDAVVEAATKAIADARVAIAGQADVPDEEKSANTATVGEIMARLETAKASRMKAMDAAQKAKDAENAAMAATAAKLYKGIAAQDGSPTTTAGGTALSAGERAAAYNDSDVPSGNTPVTPVDTRIMVGIGTEDPVALSEDKKTTVAALHGWKGKRYTAEPEDDGMYEAMVYSNVGDPTMGPKFNSGTGDGNVGFALDGTSGETPVLSGITGYAARVDSPSFDQSAGAKEFKLPANTVRVTLSGSYYGVSGTYYCTPAADSTCASRKAAMGFELGSTLDDTNAFTAGGWTFKPANPEARVMSAADAIYASYGWWIHKSEDGGTFTASAFADVKGAVPAAAALNDLEGTATYMGGAAGKYALSSSTGGKNDAGHFTARATLEADFSDNSITGTIDNFMGADGMSRDWSVELKEAAVAATGGITRIGTDQTDNDTVWTIDGGAAAASGEWSGTLYDNDDGGIPKVGTGTFYSEYGTAGRMVGAFGANKQ